MMSRVLQAASRRASGTFWSLLLHYNLDSSGYSSARLSNIIMPSPTEAHLWILSLAVPVNRALQYPRRFDSLRPSVRARWHSQSPVSTPASRSFAFQIFVPALLAPQNLRR
ncbi:hypothetical protein BDV12DRAFT_157885 [Aspergillus spectabilis]